MKITRTTWLEIVAAVVVVASLAAAVMAFAEKEGVPSNRYAPRSNAKGHVGY